MSDREMWRCFLRVETSVVRAGGWTPNVTLVAPRDVVRPEITRWGFLAELSTPEFVCVFIEGLAERPAPPPAPAPPPVTVQPPRQAPDNQSRRQYIRTHPLAAMTPPSPAMVYGFDCVPKASRPRLEALLAPVPFSDLTETSNFGPNDPHPWVAASARRRGRPRLGAPVVG
jgi:hypothetical protein